jgi:hypothetical protein
MPKKVTHLLPAGGVDHGFVYLLGLVDGRIKIGRTSRPRYRLQTHRNAFGDQFAWFHLFPGERRYFGVLAERDAIQALSAVSQRIGKTEIFSGLTRDAAMSIVRQCIQERLRQYAEWDARDAKQAQADAENRALWKAFHDFRAKALGLDSIPAIPAANQPAAA